MPNRQGITANQLISHIAQPVAMQTAEDIVQQSIVFHHPTQLAPVTYVRNLILTDTLLDSRLIGRLSPAVVLPPSQGFTQLEIVDCHTRSWQPTHTAPTLLQLFIRGNPLRGTQATVQQAQAVLAQLLQDQPIEALVLYGSPYVFETFLQLMPDKMPFLFSYGQMPAAQQITLERLFDCAGSSFGVTDKAGMF